MIKDWRKLRLVSGVSICLILSSCSVPPGYKHDDSSVWPWAKVWSPGSTDPDHPHIRAAKEENQWSADPGYTWVAVNKSLDVKWTPGLADYPGRPHIVAGDVEGKWIPAHGYDWVSEQSDSKDVKWVSGLTYAEYPHVSSAEPEGYWRAEPGYAWVNPEKTLEVTWKPYLAHPGFKNILSYTNEGYWVAMPGYKFKANFREVITASPNMEVEWYSGVVHPACPWLISGNIENHWYAAKNYEFVSTDPSNMDVRRTEESQNSEKMGKFFVLTLVTVVANIFSRPSESDSPATTTIKHGVEEVRNQAIEKAAETVLTPNDRNEYHCDMNSHAWTRAFEMLIGIKTY